MKNKALALILTLSLVAATTMISLATDDQSPKSTQPILFIEKFTPNK